MVPARGKARRSSALGRPLIEGLAHDFEAAGAAAQDEVGRPGPWLRQGGQWGAAAAEGGRHLNPREGTVHDELAVLVTREEVVDVPGLGLGIGWECYVSCTRPGKKWLCTWVNMKECFGNH